MDLLSRGLPVFVCGCALGLSVLVPNVSLAQSGGDEVISDPELAGSSSISTSDSAGETVFEDPELAGKTSASSSGSGFNNSAAPQFTADASLTWHSRLGMDLRYSDPREETWENTNIALRPTSGARRSCAFRWARGYDCTPVR